MSEQKIWTVEDTENANSLSRKYKSSFILQLYFVVNENHAIPND